MKGSNAISHILRTYKIGKVVTSTHGSIVCLFPPIPSDIYTAPVHKYGLALPSVRPRAEDVKEGFSPRLDVLSLAPPSFYDLLVLLSAE